MTKTNSELIALVENLFEEEIDLACLKLKGGRHRSVVLNWLSNFDENSIIEAIVLLQQITFISEEDLYVLCNSMIENLDAVIPIGKTLYFRPVAKYGKSATLLTYYLCKSKKFKALLESGRAVLLKDLRQLRDTNFTSDSVLIYYDDFFGSGGSLIKSINFFARNTNSSRKKISNKYAICLYYMPMAEKKIHDAYPHIEIKGELLEKQFDSTSFSYYSSPEQMKRYKRIFEEYADLKNLFTEKGKKHNLGYENSQALISFPYMPPNNALPVIWSGKSKWKPLIPRDSDYILENVTKLKNEISYAAAKLQLGVTKKMILPKHYSNFFILIIGIIRMISFRMPIVNIIKLLSISPDDMDLYLSKAIALGFINEKNQVTEKGNSELNQLLLIIKTNKIEKEYQLPFINSTYVPKNFPGKRSVQ